MTASGGDSPDDAQALRRDLGRLQVQVLELRRTVLRLVCVLALAVLAVGLLLPAWSATDSGDHRHHTYRVATLGFQILDDTEFDDQRGLQVLLAVGFLGLLVVVLLLAGVLISSVMGAHGTRRGAWVRRTLVVLALVGTLVPMVLSAVAAGSDEQDTAGGWGPVVLMVGLVLTTLILTHRPWQDLWLDQETRPQLRPLTTTALEP